MLLSIIIAAYNVETFIEKCILSCYNIKLQDNMEILVIDDGSNDRTAEKVLGLQQSIKNLTLIQQENLGLGASRNKGIDKANGKYIWMIDGDDYIENNNLSVIVNNLKDDWDLFATNYNIADQKGKLLYQSYPENYICKVLNGTEYYKLNFEKNYTWQYIFKRSIFLENNIRFKERINMQDSEILPKILYHTKKVKYLDVISYNYVQYENSFTNSQNPEKRYKYFQSIIEVRDSLQVFSEVIKNDNQELYLVIQKKIESLHQIVFNHLVFNKYKTVDFVRNIDLLKKESFFPLKAKTRGKMTLLKLGLNNFPSVTNSLLKMLNNLIK